MLGIAPERISVKATTNEKLGFIGREEGIARHCDGERHLSRRSSRMSEIAELADNFLKACASRQILVRRQNPVRVG